MRFPTQAVRIRSALGGPVRYAAIAAAGSALIAWFGPPGVDLAAHVYQRALFMQHGFQLWNNYWYAGRYSFVSYSVLYYPLAGVLGIKLLAVVTTALSAGAFARVVNREWPSAGAWPARTFTAVVPLSVLTGAFPYALGLTFALVALTALKPRRMWVFAPFTILSFAASPLAFVLLVVVLLGVAAATRFRHLLAPASVVVVVACSGFVLQRLFPSGGRFPFPSTELVALLAFCVLGAGFTFRIPAARVLHSFFIVYALAALVTFAIPTAIGENIARLRFIALPLAVLVLSLRRFRPAIPAAFVLLLAGAWNITPLAFGAVRSSEDASAAQSYWTPAIRFLEARVGPSFRVEAVDTAGHWEAVYLPQAGIPIVRGWFRQDDFPADALLYKPLRPKEYMTWLRRLAVKYVVLSNAPLDYSSVNEAALLRAGTLKLPVVFQDADVRIYAVPRPEGIVRGAAGAKVTRLGSSTMTLALPSAGPYALSLRYSPYWASSSGCISRLPGGMTRLSVPHGGRFTLRFTLSERGMIAAGTGSATATACAGRSDSGSGANSR